MKRKKKLKICPVLTSIIQYCAYLCTIPWYPGAMSSVTGCRKTFAYLQQVTYMTSVSETMYRIPFY